MGNPNPSDRGPVSTTGEEFDPEVFDDDFRFEDVFNGLPEDPFGGPCTGPNC